MSNYFYHIVIIIPLYIDRTKEKEAGAASPTRRRQPDQINIGDFLWIYPKY